MAEELTSRTALVLSDAFLSRLVAELDDEIVTAIVLGGSYARGDATFYSDVDLIRFVKEHSKQTQQKQFMYREGLLISIATRTISRYQQDFAVPERAIFVVPGIREARILLDKDGAFRALQQEAQAWTWEPLQADANYYANNIMMEYIEYAHKIIRALLVQDEYALAEITLELFLALTDAVAVQRGILAISGNTYFQQVQREVGMDSTWAHYHRLIAGIDTSATGTSNKAKGIAALRLYQETAKLLWPVFHSLYRDVIEQAMIVIDEALAHKLLLNTLP